MKTAVLVITHARVNKTFARHFPYYVKSGGEVIGVGDAHDGCVWPSGVRFLEFPIITDQRQKLLRRFMQVVDWCVTKGTAEGFDRFAICEYDVVFIRPIPSHITPRPIEFSYGRIAATLAGHKSNGFKGKNYYHCPWIFSAFAAGDFHRYGNRMLDAGIDEGGFIDRFLGLYEDLFGPAIVNSPNYSQNSLDRPEYIAEARESMKRPECFAIHGCKTPEMLQQLFA